MSEQPSALGDWTPEQIALGRRWVETWKLAGADLQRIRQQEIHELDTYRTIALLCGSSDPRGAPQALRPTSGLVEQQRWFIKAARRE